MLLKSIKYNNFRGFKGTHEINLKTTTDKNIIVILGDNTHGKSTIVQSIPWCFYGVCNFKNPDEIYNRQVMEDMSSGDTTVATVEIEFEHDNESYIARRSEAFFKNHEGSMIRKYENFKLSKIDENTGETIPCGNEESDYNKTISGIMPEDLSKFFFFEGEENHQITTKSLSSAVKELLGFDTLLKMKEHLHGTSQKQETVSSVMGRYKAKIGNDIGDSCKTLTERISKNEKAIEDYEQKRDNAINNFEEYDKKILEKQSELDALEATRALQDNKREILGNITAAKARLESSYDQYINLFKNEFLYILMEKCNKKVIEKLKKMDLSDKGIPNLHENTINALLERGTCLCGTSLAEGTLAYNNLKEYLEYAAPRNIGQDIRSFEKDMRKACDSADKYKENEPVYYNNVLADRDDLNNHEIKLDKINRQLEETGDTNVDQIVQDINQYKTRRRSFDEDKINAIIKITDLTRERDDDLKTRESIISQSKVGQQYRVYYEYAKRVYEWVSETYDSHEGSLRKNLENKVETLFNKIYNGHREVTIDEKYNIHVNPPADTGVLSVIQYFAYIGGVVQIAEEVMRSRKEGEEFGEEYPLVLDAAFSNADTIHTNNIARELSKVTNQLVFAVMDKDWEYVEKGINERIKTMYKLNKISENEISIEEV